MARKARESPTRNLVGAMEQAAPRQRGPKRGAPKATKVTLNMLCRGGVQMTAHVFLSRSQLRRKPDAEFRGAPEAFELMLHTCSGTNPLRHGRVWRGGYLGPSSRTVELRDCDLIRPSGEMQVGVELKAEAGDVLEAVPKEKEEGDTALGQEGGEQMMEGRGAAKGLAGMR